MKLRLTILLLLVTPVAVVLIWPPFRNAAVAAWQRTKSQATVDDRLNQYGEGARRRWQPYFAQAGLAYPSKRLVFVGVKDAKELQVYAADADSKPRFLRRFPILAASGGLGPKLREGDRQVPEGIYEIESLNPNSRFHLSLRVSYPNEFDRQQAAKDGRTKLGGDIMIHGSSVSIGCLAMGDEAAEDLFVLAADLGPQNILVILCPVDFRLGRSVPSNVQAPAWTETLYTQVRARLQELPLPQAP